MSLFVVAGPECGQSVALSQPVTVGRSSRCELVLSDDRVSRIHACFAPRDGGIEVTDLGSTNGVRVHGTTIWGPTRLRPGDRARIGGTHLELRSEPSDNQPNLGLKAALGFLSLVALVLGIVWVGGADATPRPAGPAHWVEVADAALPGTVMVTAFREGRQVAVGSGFVLDAAEGLIVTNHHVVNAGDDLHVGVSAGPRKASIVGAAPCDDITILRVTDWSGLATLPLGDQSGLRTGEPVLAIGYPQYATGATVPTMSTGLISVPRTVVSTEALDVPDLVNAIRIRATLSPGSSGGPLLNSQGEVVGMITAAPDDGTGDALAIGVDRLKEVVADLREGNSWAYTGLLLGFPTSADDLVAGGHDTSLFGRAILVAGVAERSGVADPSMRERARTTDGQTALISLDDRGMDGTLNGYCRAVESAPRIGSVTAKVVPPGRDAAGAEIIDLVVE